MLRISMLGVTCSTKRVEPSFPLLLHECFHFRKTLTGIPSLADLQMELSRHQVEMQLVQWQVHGRCSVVLAVFHCRLADLLYPRMATRATIAGVDVDLLMEPTTCFPGIISPKVEVSTKVVIEEMVNYLSLHTHEPAVINNKTISSKRVNCTAKEKKERKGKSKAKTSVNGSFRQRGRQKPVCHTKPSVKCYYCKKPVRGKEWAEKGPPTQPHYTPYCTNCGDVDESEPNQVRVILKENLPDCGKWEIMCPCGDPKSATIQSRTCDCRLCLKYDQLFSTSPTRSISADLQNEKSTKWKSDSLPLQFNKHDPCPCSLPRPEDIENRARAGISRSRREECQCKRCATCASLPGSRNHLDDEKSLMQENQYQNVFRTDLNTHYKKLFGRVSQRSNKRGS